MSRSSRARVGATAILVAFALAATGCDDSPPPPVAAPDPSPTSTSPAPPDRHTAPTLPDEARAHTVAGAKAFVRYYIETINFAFADEGDAGPLRVASGPPCDVCLELALAADRMHSRGGHQFGGQWSPISVLPGPIVGDLERQMIAKVEIGRGTWQASRHDKPEPTSYHKSSYVFVVKQVRGCWRTTDVSPA